MTRPPRRPGGLLRPRPWLGPAAVLLWLAAVLAPAAGGPPRTGSAALREKARRLAERFPKESRAEVLAREHGLAAFADRRPPQRGDEEQFFVDKKDRGEKKQIPAVLRLIGQHCYVYVEKGREVPDAKLAEVVKAFDGSVVPVNQAWFGTEWSPGVDGDPRVTLLFVEGLTGCDGYFDPEDEYTREKCPTSNEREMVVLAISRLDDMREFTADLLAHEYQHMIHWNHDPKEATWVDEACSAYAATLYQHFPFTVDCFIKNPNRCLIDWDDTIEWSNYGNVFLFLNHLVRHCSKGEEGRRRLVREIVASRETSVTGIAAALTRAEIPLSFNEVFRTFGAACYLGANQRDRAGRLGFDPFVQQGLAALKPDAVKPVRSFQGPRGRVKGKARMWSTLAFRFRLGAAPKPFAVSFAGESFEARKGRNFFDVGLLFLNQKGERDPHLSWMNLRDNAGEQTLAAPGEGYDEVLILVCNRGPAKLPANEKRWPPVPFVLEVGPAEDQEIARTRFDRLHREP